MICLSCVLLPFYLPFFGVRLLGIVLDLSIIFCVTAMIVYLALRQMIFMNQSIGRYLQSSHDA